MYDNALRVLHRRNCDPVIVSLRIQSPDFAFCGHNIQTGLTHGF
jgi:hypothetical protein